uniref:Uncharacterized protein n=1 Tax=Anguilla anguilla TaxID=7936 RepID=A0A0E9SU56_ANGAN
MPATGLLYQHEKTLFDIFIFFNRSVLLTPEYHSTTNGDKLN